ncbi:MAG TPA: hypothetical protein VGD50_03335, partial [Candidatus Baltobacteraceae bacterium]
APAAMAATQAPAAAAPVIVADMDDARFAGPHDVQGRITYFNEFTLRLSVHGTILRVHLHQGTIIHPTGLTLHSGMLVNVHGYWLNGVFRAGRISLIQ